MQRISAPRRPRVFYRRTATGVFALLAGVLTIPAAPSRAATVPAPTAVAIAGDFDALLGCGGDWAPNCPQAQMTPRAIDGVWQLTATLPAGSYNYKAALNMNWTINYGLHAAPGGANIPLTVPAGGASVTFLYDDITHWVTDTINNPIATVAGDFQSELGCPSDWAPDCLRSWVQDPDGDGTYTFATTAIPAGDYNVKATLGMSWAVNFGANGVPGGANIPFTVTTDGDTTTFSFDATSHVLTVYAGLPRPSLAKRSGYWLTPDTIAWDLGASPASQTYQLAAAPGGGLVVGAAGLTNGTVIPLTYDPAGLTPALVAKFPHLATLGVLHLPAGAAAQAADLLRGQVAIASLNAAGQLTGATGLQTAGVLDVLYAANAATAKFGPVFVGGRPTLTVWAPTANDVSVQLFDTSTTSTSELVPMTRNAATGAWSVTGERSWANKYYLYQVTVWNPTTQTVTVNMVTDPYSLALSANSTRSEIVNLDDPSLKPAAYDRARSPGKLPLGQQQIQEMHVRDFSVADANVPAAQQGTYLAFANRDSAGRQHLRSLAKAGVTAVQILPVFDFAGVEEVRANQATPACDLPSFAPDSAQQQACIAATQSTDAYNWGYNPLHFTVPEGSYATVPDGAQRTVQFRQMVAALHQEGLRVVMDVVYNHTAAAGQAPDSVLDQIVPGYYHRLDGVGAVTKDSCCADTAPENAMMNKLVVDSVTTWARDYHVDGFRFDLMGIDPKQTMLDVKASLDLLTVGHDGIDGTAALLYGEGWDFGVAAHNARFVQATQANMAGTGIGTFNDRLRDAVRGGSIFDTNPRIQGFGSGQYVFPNGDPINGSSAEQKATLLHDMDLVKLGLTGNLAKYSFVDSEGDTVTGDQLIYDGHPAGYTAAPGEAIGYVDAHDNVDLYDNNAFKLSTTTTPAERVRLQALGLATSSLTQGPGFSQAGTDLLRSKSLDSNSYDSGDWFNAIHWDCGTGNGFGHGLPLAESNQAMWPFAQPLLADPSLVPNCTQMATSAELFQQWLQIKRSSPLFSLATATEVQRRLSFPLSGQAGELPGVITERLDGSGLRTYKSITVIFNATPTAVTQTIGALAGTRMQLHPVQQSGGDPTVRLSQFSRSTGTFSVPAFTVAVFVSQ